MQYWINHNGVQSGPVDIDGLKEMALTSRAYVWHEGLTDWVKIAQVPELQGLFVEVADDAVVETPPIPPAETLGQKRQPEAASSVDAEVPARSSAPQGGGTAPQSWQRSQQGAWPHEAAAPEAPAPKKCPPTNLAWAIFSTLCCCMPAGIVGIIYAIKVTNKFNAGDIEGAERASETSAWWCIASIVLGIITAPLSFMLPLLTQQS